MRHSSVNQHHHHHHGQEYALEESAKQKRNITIVTLLATCLFLFILVLCLITALIFVGKFSATPSGFSIAKPLDAYKTNENNGNESFIAAFHLKNRARNMNFDKANKQKFRLPASVRPLYYDLRLNPNFDTEDFTGSVKISLKVLEPTKSVILHANKLAISDYSLSQLSESGQSKNVNITSAYEYDKNEYFVMETNLLEAGDYILRMEFNGSMGSKLVGLYSSKYFDKELDERRYCGIGELSLMGKATVITDSKMVVYLFFVSEPSSAANLNRLSPVRHSPASTNQP
jgi:hypothetical protein